MWPLVDFNMCSARLLRYANLFRFCFIKTNFDILSQDLRNFQRRLGFSGDFFAKSIRKNLGIFEINFWICGGIFVLFWSRELAMSF